MMRRLRQLKKEYRVEFAVLGVIPANRFLRFLEERLHARFAHLATPVRSPKFGSRSIEWFSPEPELLDAISLHAIPWRGEALIETSERKIPAWIDLSSDRIREGISLIRSTLVPHPMKGKKYPRKKAG